MEGGLQRQPGNDELGTLPPSVTWRQHFLWQERPAPWAHTFLLLAVNKASQCSLAMCIAWDVMGAGAGWSKAPPSLGSVWEGNSASVFALWGSWKGPFR